MSPCLLQIDQLKQELSKKESELLGLQTKLETLNNQNSDCKQHIEVLKESLTAKEQRAAILQTEVRFLGLSPFSNSSAHNFLIVTVEGADLYINNQCKLDFMFSCRLDILVIFCLIPFA